MAKKFCNRFHLPYSSFLDLLNQVKSGSRFDHWCGYKSNGKKSSPLKLLLLGMLQYFGWGWHFHDIEEKTAISISVHHNFFHVFIYFGSTSLYSQHILTPVHLAEAHLIMAEYMEAGFPGCVGSSDCTNITTERCKYFLNNNHLGAKSSHTTPTFNSLTGNYILAGRKIVLFDRYVGDLYVGIVQ